LEARDSWAIEASDATLIDKRIFGFVFAGGLATILNYSLFLYLLGLSFNPSIAASIGYVSGIVVSFLINRFAVFRSSRKASFVRYLLAYLVALVVQLLLLNGFIAIGIAPGVANAIAISLVVVLNFYAVRRLAF